MQIFLFWKCWTYQNLVQCIFEHAHLWNMFIPLEGECHWVLSGFVCLYMHMIMFIADIYILFCWKQWTLARQESEREREKLSPMTTKRPYKRFLSLECRYSCHRCQFNGEHGGYSYHHRQHCHCHHRPRCVKSRMTSQPAIGSSMWWRSHCLANTKGYQSCHKKSVHNVECVYSPTTVSHHHHTALPEPWCTWHGTKTFFWQNE